MSVNDYNKIMLTAGAPKLMAEQQRFTARMREDFQNTINHLNQLWDQVHMEPANREARVQQACDFVHNLLRDIITSEEEMVKSVALDLEARRNAVIDLRKLLNQPSFNESLYKPGSITLLKALDDEVNRLIKKRDEMMGEQFESFAKYEKYCQRLGITPERIEGIRERVFTDYELKSLQNKVNDSKRTFATRLDNALQFQSEAKKIFNIIQLPENNSINREDLQYLHIDLHSQSTVLTQELLDHLTLLNQRLKDHYDSWIEQVAFRYDEMLVKLDELSEKCFRPPFSKDLQRTDYEHLTEKELQKLEDELRTRQELYYRAQTVFDKLNEWMDSWKKKLDTERRVCRASFYKNRAGSLNEKLKQRKLVEQQVPKLYNELREICDEYVKNYSVYDILVEGLRADKYAESLMRGYTQDKELNRVQKQITSSKTAQTPGPKTPSTTRTRNVFATTTPTRTTVRKLIMQQPATVGPIRRKRSFSCSQLSAIYPLKSPTRIGPQTSSPKKPEWS